MFALMAFAFQSCKKTNGIDNNAVITKPYTLYVIDSAGTIYNTNNGSGYKKIIFPADGIPPRAFTTYFNSILMIKSSPNAFLSSNEGAQFSSTYSNVSPSAFHESMIIDVPSFDRVYIASSDTKGIAYSKDSTGEQWIADNDNGLGTTASITSFTQLENGTLVAFDDAARSIFIKPNVGSGWAQKTASGLPATGSGQMFITHYGNTIVAVDATGLDGVYYSTDDGDNWQKYSGLPAGVRIYSAYSPFEKALLIGLEGHGAYRLPLGSTTFAPANVGFEANTSVRSIVAKDDYFKNNSIKEYVYAATNNGLYRSEDNGSNWTRIKSGNYVLVH